MARLGPSRGRVRVTVACASCTHTRMMYNRGDRDNMYCVRKERTRWRNQLCRGTAALSSEYPPSPHPYRALFAGRPACVHDCRRVKGTPGRREENGEDARRQIDERAVDREGRKRQRNIKSGRRQRRFGRPMETCTPDKKRERKIKCHVRPCPPLLSPSVYIVLLRRTLGRDGTHIHTHKSLQGLKPYGRTVNACTIRNTLRCPGRV